MKTVTKLSLGATAAIMAITAIGGTSMHFSAAIAGDRDDTRAAKQAGRAAAAARKAIDQRRYDVAVAQAELAVGMAPADASMRALLGQAYLSSGRFLSAAQSLDESLTLDAGNGRAALNLVLARIAMGQWDEARATLANHAAVIPIADRGLALALAGDPMGGVQLLGEAARATDAGPKVRQNLALSLALAGRWPEAKTIAEIDLSPADVNNRLLQWAAFARPANASDQVAALLGVVPVANDQGRPMQLALAAPVGGIATAAVVPIEAAPVDMAATAPEMMAPAPTTSIDVPQAAARPRIVFAERREIVQTLPTGERGSPVRMAVAPAERPRAATLVARAKARAFATGSYYVQLGAYESAGVARDAWGRMASRAGMRGLRPNVSDVTTAGQSYHRLSVGGFARGDADRFCRSLRATGGRCFVREHAGDRIANWARGPVMASR